MRVARKVLGMAVLLGGSGAAAADPDRVAYGEYLSSQCVTCHQASGAEKGIPSIIGWDIASFVNVMASYKKKERENPVMQSIAGSLSDDDIFALATYFATVKTAEN